MRRLSAFLFLWIAPSAATFEGSYGGSAGYEPYQQQTFHREACPDYAVYSTYAQ